MAAVVTFDFVDRLIIEVNTGLDVNTIDVDEIYSEWKIAAQSGNNLGIEIAFTVVQPDEVGAVGAKHFLENGWKFRPAEYDHDVILRGSLKSRIGTIGVPTLGGYTVYVTLEASNIVDKFFELATKKLIYPLYGGL